MTDAASITVGAFSFHDFLGLEDDEHRLVLSWRNHPDVRSRMFTPDAIAWTSHRQFVESLRRSDDKVYWMVRYRGAPSAVADLYRIDARSCWWGYYVAPELQGSSLGFPLEYAILHVVFERLGKDELWCETLATNDRVLKLHAFFGFVPASPPAAAQGPGAANAVTLKLDRPLWKAREAELRPLVARFLDPS